MECWGYLPAGAGIRETTALLSEGATGMAKAFALVVRGRYRAMQGDLAGGRADTDGRQGSDPRVRRRLLRRR